MRLTRPSISDEVAVALGRAVVVNRWRAALLNEAAVRIGAVLDDASNAPPLTDKARDALRDAMIACVMHALALEGVPR